MKSKVLLTFVVGVLVLPASALAVNSPELTYPTGTKLGTETKLQATNVGDSKLTWGATTLTCSSAKWKGALKKNSGSEIEADVETASFNSGGQCTTGAKHGASVSTTPELNGTPWCLRSTPELIEDEFQIRGGKCSEGHRSIGLTITTYSTLTLYECAYERAGAVVGTFETSPADARLTSNKVNYARISGGFICPESMELDTSFTLQKEEGSSGPTYLSAGPRLTFPSGTTLATGSKLKGTNVGNITMTSTSGSITCSIGEITGTLKKNSGTEVEADIETASFSGAEPGGNCSYFTGYPNWTLSPATNGLPWCLRATSAMGADEFQLRGNNCGGASRPIRLIFEVLLLQSTECHYSRAAALSGTFTKHPADAAFSFKSATFLEAEPKSGSCSDEVQLDSTMTLERESESKPLYIS